MGALNLGSMLTAFGFVSEAKVKLVRHSDPKLDITTIRQSGHFDFYQSVQRRDVFRNCDVLISFVATAGTYATFAGIYKVRGVKTPKRIDIPNGFPFPAMNVSGCFLYDLDLDVQFAELADRLVIDWGPGVKAWVQLYRTNAEKDVVELLPAGHGTHFPGFERVLLTYDELSRIVRHPLAHREWHLMLRSVAAVYLILDANTGHQYVGSAYGVNGLLGRWRAYAQSPSGGNSKLAALLQQRPGAERDFRYSILRTLPATLTAQEVIRIEYFYKQVLGSRAFGLNLN